MPTFRTETRHVQGSNTAVTEFAIIVHSKQNFFRQRTL